MISSRLKVETIKPLALEKVSAYVQGASAGHQLGFVELKLLISVSNSGGSATYINNGMLRHILHVHYSMPDQDQVGHVAGKVGGSKVV